MGDATTGSFPSTPAAELAEGTRAVQTYEDGSKSAFIVKNGRWYRYNPLREVWNGCRQGDSDWVLDYFECVDDINKEGDDGRTPLWHACKNGHGHIVDILLQHEHINVNYVNGSKVVPSAILAAAKAGHDDIVTRLLAHPGIEVPLQLVSFVTTRSRIGLLESLLANGVDVIGILLAGDPDEPDEDYISNAFTFGDLGIVSRLFDADDELRRIDACSILGVAFFKGPMVMDRLLKYEGVDVNILSEDGTTLLFEVCARGDDGAALDTLLEIADIDVNKACDMSDFKARWSSLDENPVLVYPPTLEYSGYTPLCIVCLMGHGRIVDKLLGMEGIDVNKEATDGETPLLIACRMGHADIVHKLLNARGIDVNKAATKDGLTPLLVACKKKNIKDESGEPQPRDRITYVMEGIVARLLDTETIDVNKACALNGETPLTVACRAGSIGIARMLLAKEGINVNQTVPGGETAFTVAVREHHHEISDRMLEINWKVFDSDQVNPEDGTTPLWHACDTDNVHVVEELLEHRRPDVNRRAHNGQTPLAAACFKNNYDIVETLLSRSHVLPLSSDTLVDALAIACENNRHDIVALLLDAPPEEGIVEQYFWKRKAWSAIVPTRYFEAQDRILHRFEDDQFRIDATLYLHHCIRGERWDLVCKLLTHKGKLDIRPSAEVHGSTLLGLACAAHKHRSRFARYLCTLPGVDVARDIPDADQATLLRYALAPRQVLLAAWGSHRAAARRRVQAPVARSWPHAVLQKLPRAAFAELMEQLAFSTAAST